MNTGIAGGVAVLHLIKVLGHLILSNHFW